VSELLRTIDWSSASDDERRSLLERGTAAIFDPELRASLAALVEDVRERGDAAVIDALARFDGCAVAPGGLRVTDDEFEAADRAVPAGVKDALRAGIANIRAFNEALTRERRWQVEIAPGIEAGEKLTPVASAGLFVPSGKGSFPSVVIQLGTPAVVAGVPELAIVVPPLPGGAGEVDPAVLVAAAELGIRNVFRANGPAGVAALAFGTESIPKVRKVVGPGSPPVASVQIECQRYGCHTQMLLGPSESLIIADDSADVRLLALDLLNEAEHGPDSSSVLVTTSAGLIARADAELTRLIEELPEPRRGYARIALGENGGAVLCSDIEQVAEVANAYAPEHMQIATADDEAVLAMIDHAGEVLLGQATPMSAANYVVGVPAALPTGGFARVTGGVTAQTFLKAMSIARLSPAAIERLTPHVVALAEHEGFPAHANAARGRIHRS